MKYIIKKGAEAQFIWGSWNVPVVVMEVSESWAIIRYPLEEPIGPGVYIDLLLTFPEFNAGFHYFTLNAPKQFNDLLYLQRAGSRTYTEKRVSWRVKVAEPVLVECGTNHITFPATVTDLSTSGALISVEHLLPVSNPIKLQIKLGSKPYILNALLVRKVPLDYKTGSPMQLGIKFVNNPIQVRNALTKYLWKRIREQYDMDFSEIYPGAGKRRKKDESSDSKDQFVPLDFWVNKMNRNNQEKPQ